MDDTSWRVITPLLVLAVLGLLLALAGGRDMFVAFTEDCLVGTEVQRCTPGQGRLRFWSGLAIAAPSLIGVVATVIRRRRSSPRGGA